MTQRLLRHCETYTLGKALRKIEGWAKKWRVKINASKSQALLVSKRRTGERRPILQLLGERIPWTTTARYLGVTIDSRLTWKQHIREVRNKVQARVSTLYPILNAKSTLHPRVGIKVYQTLIRPIMEYASPVWVYAADTHLKTLVAIERKCLRRVLHLPYNFPNTDTREMSGVKHLWDRILELARGFYRSAHTSENHLAAQLGRYDPQRRVNRNRPLSMFD